MVKKTQSAGVVITDGDLILIGHVTNHAYWDIPKGQMDAGESALEAAVRECEEETGIRIPASELIMLGLYDYKPKKDLQLYLWCVDQMPDPTTCVCKSKFKNSTGTWQPELDSFKCISWSEITQHCQPHMQKVLNILEKKARDTAHKHRARTA